MRIFHLWEESRGQKIATDDPVLFQLRRLTQALGMRTLLDPDIGVLDRQLQLERNTIQDCCRCIQSLLKTQNNLDKALHVLVSNALRNCIGGNFAPRSKKGYTEETYYVRVVPELIQLGMLRHRTS